MKPSPQLQQAVKDFVISAGSTNAAAGRLGVSRDVLGRVAAGLEVREGTVMVLKERLKKQDGKLKVVR
jgi:hypothetical protein